MGFDSWGNAPVCADFSYSANSTADDESIESEDFADNAASIVGRQRRDGQTVAKGERGMLGGRGLCRLVLTAALIAPTGCVRQKEFYFHDSGELAHYKAVATEIEFPCAEVPANAGTLATGAPRRIDEQVPPEYWNLSLDEAVHLALANSRVFRDLGGHLVQNPESVRSIYEPAVAEADPIFGVEGALSAFDAEFSTSVFWERDDRVLNNEFEGGGTRLLEQDLGTFQAQIRKRAATGSVFTLRNNIDYTFNNVPTNIFPSAWNNNIEAEVRQPLLQGAGVAFNRIAGPNATPGLYLSHGVLIARTNTDISLADFETGVCNLVSDVENAYWDLYYAYRDFDAKRAARDRALETWRGIKSRVQTGSRPVYDEAQALEQYFVFEGEVENALGGLPGRGTSSGSGSAGGTFRGEGGIFSSERRLRFIVGLPANDGRLIRTSDEPSQANVLFDWAAIQQEAIVRRVELRKQRWKVKRRELELLASRNFVQPTLDAVGLYRWRGFGNDLIDPDSDEGRFNNAVQNLVDGDFQEWQMGLQLNIPIGFRQALAGVRHAQLRLSRERALLADQELQVSHDLSGAAGEVNRAYVLLRTSFNRRVAAQEQLKSVEAPFHAGVDIPLDLLLDAQRRLAEAESSYYRALSEYALAIKNVHYEKGSLLDYHLVSLSEGAWPAAAYGDARRRAHERAIAVPIPFGVTRPHDVSAGPLGSHMQSQSGQPSPVEEVPAPTGAPPATRDATEPTETMPPPSATDSLPQPSHSAPNETPETNDPQVEPNLLEPIQQPNPFEGDSSRDLERLPTVEVAPGNTD